MTKLFDKLRLESNEDKSSMGDSVARIANASGSFGFGWTIGPLLFSWLPFPVIWASILGAFYTVGIFDFMLAVWESRGEIQSGSKKQNKISKQGATVSLGASTVATAAFLMLNLLPFIFQGGQLENMLFNTRLVLGSAVVIVTAYQVVTNTLWLRENPARQRDRNKAESYSSLSDEMVEIESDILGKVPAVLRQKTQGYINKIVDGIAREKADEIIRTMGYGELVDGQAQGPTNADLLAKIAGLEAQLKAGNDSAEPQLVDLYLNGESRRNGARNGTTAN